MGGRGRGAEAEGVDEARPVEVESHDAGNGSKDRWGLLGPDGYGTGR
jgi:hypothetical protein